jgi:hypothetical protein
MSLLTGIFKQIFRDGWTAFKERYPRYRAVAEVVQKMLRCSEFENGHAGYICPKCRQRSNQLQAIHHRPAKRYQETASPWIGTEVH